MVQVFLCGPGGAGKTTLSEALAKKEEFKHYFFIKEVARNVMKEHNITKKDIEGYNLQEFIGFQNLILKYQYTEECKHEGENMVSDRCVIDCVAYSYWKYEEQMKERPTLDIVSQWNKANVCSAFLLHFLPIKAALNITLTINPIMLSVHKMAKHMLKILEQMLQNF